MLQEKHYIKRFYISGCTMNTTDRETAKDFSENRDTSNHILIYLGDIDTCAPQLYTRAYTLQFFRLILNGIIDAAKQKNCIYKLWIKEKKHNDMKLLLTDATLQKLLASPFITWQTFLSVESYESVLKSISTVMSIGFTSPGMMCLLAGKKTIYVTPYAFNYCAVFHPALPWFAHTDEQISAFLQEESTISDEQLVSLDPYRDAQAANRIADSLISLC
jgi:hypothetical protein